VEVNLIDVKIVNKGNDIYTFTDIKGNNYDAKISIGGKIKSFENLQRLARWINLLIMKKDNEIEYLNNIKSLDGDENIFALFGTKEVLVKESLDNLINSESGISNIEKLFSDSLTI